VLEIPTTNNNDRSFNAMPSRHEMLLRNNRVYRRRLNDHISEYLRGDVHDVSAIRVNLPHLRLRAVPDDVRQRMLLLRNNSQTNTNCKNRRCCRRCRRIRRRCRRRRPRHSRRWHGCRKKVHGGRYVWRK